MSLNVRQKADEGCVIGEVNKRDKLEELGLGDLMENEMNKKLTSLTGPFELLRQTGKS